MIADRQPVGWGRGVFAGVALFILSQVVLTPALIVFGDERSPSVFVGVVFAGICIGCIPLVISVAFELAFAYRRREWSLFGVAPARQIATSVAAFLGMALAALVVAGVLNAIFGVKQPTEDDLFGGSTGYELFVAASAILFAPWVEEVSIRGFLLGGLTRRFGFWIAAGASAALWSAAHFDLFVLTLFTLWGILLAWLRRRTGSLLPGIAIHGTWNTFVTILNQPWWMGLLFWGMLAGSVVIAARRVPEPVEYVEPPAEPASAMPHGLPGPPDTELTRRFPAPAVMGVINVTPDSFSDGGLYLGTDAAVAHGLELAELGADVLDVGGESTRPGSDPVSLDEELQRVLPVIQALVARTSVAVSIDTMKAEVARQAIAAGASFVNDVSALRHDPAMASVVAEAGVPVCLMHMQGTPKTMQDDPRYADVVGEVAEFLLERARHAESQGIRRELICLDPGIGFGKTMEHNLVLLNELDKLVRLGYPILIAVSRKRFIGQITGRAERERVAGTVAANLEAYARGAWMFRVHDAGPAREALDVAAAIRRARR